MSPSWAGRSSTGDSSATVDAQHVQLVLDELLGHLRLGVRRPRAVVQSATSGFGSTATVAVKLPVLRRRTSAARSRARAAPTGRIRGRATAFQNQPRDVALDRLRVEALLADAADTSTGIGTLPLRKPGNLDARGEVGGRVLDGVVDVRARNVDREPDLVVRQLLDLRRHAAIRPAELRRRLGHVRSAPESRYARLR